MTLALNNTFIMPAVNFNMLALNPATLTNIRPVNSSMSMSPLIFQQGVGRQPIQGPLQHPIFDPANKARGVKADASVQFGRTGRFDRLAAGAMTLLGSAMTGCGIQDIYEYEAHLVFTALGLIAAMPLFMHLLGRWENRGSARYLNGKKGIEGIKDAIRAGAEPRFLMKYKVNEFSAIEAVVELWVDEEAGRLTNDGKSEARAFAFANVERGLVTNSLLSNRINYVKGPMYTLFITNAHLQHARAHLSRMAFNEGFVNSSELVRTRQTEQVKSHAPA